jgi:hypothetical protein
VSILVDVVIMKHGFGTLETINDIEFPEAPVKDDLFKWETANGPAGGRLFKVVQRRWYISAVSKYLSKLIIGVMVVSE